MTKAIPFLQKAILLSYDPLPLSQSACVSYSDVEAGFAKDIIPAGDNILRAAFNNFHDSR